MKNVYKFGFFLIFFLSMTTIAHAKDMSKDLLVYENTYYEINFQNTLEKQSLSNLIGLLELKKEHDYVNRTGLLFNGLAIYEIRDVVPNEKIAIEVSGNFYLATSISIDTYTFPEIIKDTEQPFENINVVQENIDEINSIDNFIEICESATDHPNYNDLNVIYIACPQAIITTSEEAPTEVVQAESNEGIQIEPTEVEKVETNEAIQVEAKKDNERIQSKEVKVPSPSNTEVLINIPKEEPPLTNANEYTKLSLEIEEKAALPVIKETTTEHVLDKNKNLKTYLSISLVLVLMISGIIYFYKNKRENT